MKKYLFILLALAVAGVAISCDKDRDIQTIGNSNELYDGSDNYKGEEGEPVYHGDICPFIVGFAIFDKDNNNLIGCEENLKKVEIEYEKDVYVFDPINWYLQAPILGRCVPTIFIGDAYISYSVFYFGPLQWFEEANFTVRYEGHSWDIKSNCSLVPGKILLDLETYINGVLTEKVFIESFTYEWAEGIDEAKLYAYPLYI